MKVLEAGYGRRKLLKESIGVDIRRLKEIDGHSRCLPPALPQRNLRSHPPLWKAWAHQGIQQGISELCRVTKEPILITMPHKIAVFYRMLHPGREYPHENYLSLRDLQIPHDWMLLWKRSVLYQQICLRRKWSQLNVHYAVFQGRIFIFKVSAAPAIWHLQISLPFRHAFFTKVVDPILSRERFSVWRTTYLATWCIWYIWCINFERGKVII